MEPSRGRLPTGTPTEEPARPISGGRAEPSQSNGPDPATRQSASLILWAEDSAPRGGGKVFSLVGQPPWYGSHGPISALCQ